MTLKQLYARIYQQIENVRIEDLFESANRVIDEMNIRGITQEQVLTVNANQDGIIDLSSLAVVDVLRVKDSFDFALLPKTREYILNYASSGELVYNLTGKKIYVKPRTLDTFTITNLITFSNPDQVTYTGTSQNFWLTHELVPGVDIGISGAANTENNGNATVEALINTVINGSHTGDTSGFLIDSSASFPTDGSLVGKTIRNLTAGATGTITGNTATDVYAVMTLDNAQDLPDTPDEPDEREAVSGHPWQKSDSYQIISQRGNVMQIDKTDYLVNEVAASNITFTLQTFVFRVIANMGITKFTAKEASNEITLMTEYETVLYKGTLYYLFKMKRYEDPGRMNIALQEYQNEMNLANLTREEYSE